MAKNDNVVERCVAYFKEDCGSGLEVEIRGIMVALRLTNNLGCSIAWFFSDSIEAIWSVQNGGGGGWDCSELMQEGL